MSNIFRITPTVGGIEGSEKMLGQAKPAATSATLYSPGTGVFGIIYRIFVTNTGAGTPKFDICHDDNGTTFDSTTAIVWQEPLAAVGTGSTASPPSSIMYDVYIPLYDTTGAVGVISNTSDVVFTAYGVEIHGAPGV